VCATSSTEWPWRSSTARRRMNHEWHVVIAPTFDAMTDFAEGWRGPPSNRTTASWTREDASSSRRRTTTRAHFRRVSRRLAGRALWIHDHTGREVVEGSSTKQARSRTPRGGAPRRSIWLHRSARTLVIEPKFAGPAISATRARRLPSSCGKGSDPSWHPCAIQRSVGRSAGRSAGLSRNE